MARCGCNSICACLVTALDTPSVDVTVTGTGSAAQPYVVSAAVLYSADAGNLAHAGSDGGIFTGPPTVADTETIDLTLGPDGTISAQAILSGEPNNCLIVQPDGLFSPCLDGSETIVQGDGSTALVVGTGTAVDPYVVSSLAAVPPLGCGLEVDGGGFLQVNVEDAANWAYPCTIDAGAEIFCGPDGQLYGLPDHTSTGSAVFGSVFSGTITLAQWDNIHGVSGDIPIGAANAITLTNPSTCRSMLFTLWVGINHGQFNLNDGGNITQAAYAKVTASTDPGIAVGSNTQTIHEHWVNTGATQIQFDVQNQMGYNHYVIDPGASISLQFHSVATLSGGTGSVTNLNLYAFWDGKTI